MPEEEQSHVWHLFVVRVQNRSDFQQYMISKGVETLVHYPIASHKQKAYKEELNKFSYPITELLSREVVSLPISPVLSKEQMEYVVFLVNNYI